MCGDSWCVIDTTCEGVVRKQRRKAEMRLPLAGRERRDSRQWCISPCCRELLTESETAPTTKHHSTSITPGVFARGFCRDSDPGKGLRRGASCKASRGVSRSCRQCLQLPGAHPYRLRRFAPLPLLYPKGGASICIWGDSIISGGGTWFACSPSATHTTHCTVLHARPGCQWPSRSRHVQTRTLSASKCRSVSHHHHHNRPEAPYSQSYMRPGHGQEPVGCQLPTQRAINRCLAGIRLYSAVQPHVCQSRDHWRASVESYRQGCTFNALWHSCIHAFIGADVTNTSIVVSVWILRHECRMRQCIAAPHSPGLSQYCAH